MKGDKKRRKSMFKHGNKCRSGRQSVSKVTPSSEYVRPTAEEAELMDVDQVVHDAMASTSTSTDQKPCCCAPYSNSQSTSVLEAERQVILAEYTLYSIEIYL